jgi:hypothetical protein
MPIKRYAIVTGLDATAETVARYLPSNYRVLATTSQGVVIQGTDAHGWTFDGYIAPRLGSGLMRAVEVDLSHPALKEIPEESVTGPDLVLKHLGTAAVLEPLTDDGRRWLKANVAFQEWQRVGRDGIACDPRLALDVLEGAEKDGLRVGTR